MYMIPKVILSGCQMICCEIMTVNVTLPASKYILVKGVVYSPIGVPLPNAAIEVLQIDKKGYPPLEKSIGVTFTSYDGSYGISLPRSLRYDYKLIAYSSADSWK